MRAFVMSAVWLAGVSALPGSLAAQRPPTLDGAWAHVAMRIVAPDTTLVGPVLSGLAVISGRHFSELFVLPAATGVLQSGAPATTEQKASRYDVLVAISGTVETRDSAITFRHEHDKDPSLVGMTDTRHFRLRGDTLVLTSTSPWQKDSTKSVRTILTFVRRR